MWCVWLRQHGSAFDHTRSMFFRCKSSNWTMVTSVMYLSAYAKCMVQLHTYVNHVHMCLYYEHSISWCAYLHADKCSYTSTKGQGICICKRTLINIYTGSCEKYLAKIHYDRAVTFCLCRSFGFRILRYWLACMRARCVPLQVCCWGGCQSLLFMCVEVWIYMFGGFVPLSACCQGDSPPMSPSWAPRCRTCV